MLIKIQSIDGNSIVLAKDAEASSATDELVIGIECSGKRSSFRSSEIAVAISAFIEQYKFERDNGML